MCVCFAFGTPSMDFAAHTMAEKSHKFLNGIIRIRLRNRQFRAKCVSNPCINSQLQLPNVVTSARQILVGSHKTLDISSCSRYTLFERKKFLWYDDESNRSQHFRKITFLLVDTLHFTVWRLIYDQLLMDK